MPSKSSCRASFFNLPHNDNLLEDRLELLACQAESDYHRNWTIYNPYDFIKDPISVAA
jgi:hypothetical protein